MMLALLARSLFLSKLILNGMFACAESSDDVWSDATERRQLGLPIMVTNYCAATIYPAFLTQAGTGPSVGGFELGSGSSQSVTVSDDWQGRVWGRTNCSFDGSGTAASSDGGLNGGGQACVTGDCNGEVSCTVAVSGRCGGGFLTDVLRRATLQRRWPSSSSSPRPVRRSTTSRWWMGTTYRLPSC